MKNAILVPGRPDKDLHYDPEFPNNSENYWFSWLKRQLIVEDIQADTIEPPLPFSHGMNFGRRSSNGSTFFQKRYSLGTVAAVVSCYAI